MDFAPPDTPASDWTQQLQDSSCKTTFHSIEGTEPTYFVVWVTNITRPRTTKLHLFRKTLTDAIRHYMQRRNSDFNKVEVDYWDMFIDVVLGLCSMVKQSEMTSLKKHKPLSEMQFWLFG
jgi:hypothetical protein